jgi:DNA polymerase-4
VEQFWNLSPRHARSIWGSLGGEQFWYRLHGYDVPERETSRRGIGHSRVLDPDIRAPEPARLMARRLTVKAASRMRREEFYASIFYLAARLCDGRRWAGEARLAPSQDNFAFLEALDDLWDVMICEGSSNARIKIKKVSVTLTGLCRGEEITTDLFDASSAVLNEARQRNETLSKTIDLLNRKYGSETVRLGVTPLTKAGHVGTKIAFARVPDKSEFLE